MGIEWQNWLFKWNLKGFMGFRWKENVWYSQLKEGEQQRILAYQEHDIDDNDLKLMWCPSVSPVWTTHERIHVNIMMHICDERGRKTKQKKNCNFSAELKPFHRMLSLYIVSSMPTEYKTSYRRLVGRCRRFSCIWWILNSLQFIPSHNLL